MKRRDILAFGLCGAIALPARAQAWPTRPIRLVVPFGAGTTTDTLAREFARRLGDEIGQPVVVENRPGAGGGIGTQNVIQSPADGYSLLLGTIGVFAINQHLYQSLPYDPARLTPVIQVARVPNVLVVHPSVPARNVREFIAWARANGGRLSYGSTGNGTSPHLAGELLKSQGGFEAVHVPYSGAQAVTDLLAGQIQFMFYHTTGVLPLLADGRLRALAISDGERNARMPDVPTFAEAGYPEIEVSAWIGLAAPHGTPAAIVEALARAGDQVLRKPDIRDAYQQSGATAVGGTAERFRTLIKTESDRWRSVIQRAGIKL